MIRTAVLRQPAPWVIVLCAGAILTLGMGIRNSFGLFLQPVSLDLALPREVFGLAIAIQMLVWGASQPIFGGLADRFGAARVALLGAVLYMAGLLVMSQAGGPWGLHIGVGVLVGMGISATGFAVVLGPVGRAYPAEKRSMALGIAAAGGSVGQFAMAPISGALIGGYGWSAALLILVIFAALMIPLTMGVRGKAEAEAGSAESLGAALREARSHRGFWLLTAGFFVCGFHVAFIATHLPPFLADHGLADMLGATAIGLIGLFNIIGTFTAGWAGGRYRKKYTLSLFYLARAVVIAGFILVPVSETSVLVFSAAIGFLWLGTVPLTSGLVAEIFGARYLGALFGIVFMGHQLGGFLGAWLGGYISDATGSYTQVWLIAIALGVAAAALHWPIGDKPIERSARQPAGAE